MQFYWRLSRPKYTSSRLPVLQLVGRVHSSEKSRNDRVGVPKKALRRRPNGSLQTQQLAPTLLHPQAFDTGRGVFPSTNEAMSPLELSALGHVDRHFGHAAGLRRLKTDCTLHAHARP